MSISKTGDQRDCYDKPVWTLRRLLAVFPSMPGHLRAVLPTLWGERLSNAERERLMLAVATQNRCRYCKAAHDRFGRAAGLSAEEVGHLLEGSEDPRLGERDRLAVRFVRDLAARDFASHDPELRAALLARFGEEQSHTIEATARVMNFANRFGNSFDALLARLSGRCDASGASWVDLAVTSSAFVLTVLALAGPLALSFAASLVSERSMRGWRSQC